LSSCGLNFRHLEQQLYVIVQNLCYLIYLIRFVLIAVKLVRFY
jgi:hypothetical protein